MCIRDSAALHGVGRLDERYACLVGWSDRQATPVLALGAVARGACLVVKPFTDDRARRGPEHASALDTAAFAAMVAAIRELEPALGEPRTRRGPLSLIHISEPTRLLSISYAVFCL